MSRRQWFTFIALSLLPFVIALTFRASDNYFFRLHKHKLMKEGSNYYPKAVPESTEDISRYEFSCQELAVESDSLAVGAPGM